MKSDTPLDYAIFNVSPKRSRCELLVSGNGDIEKLASGLLKPFVTNLKFAEEKISQAVQSIKLDVDKCKNDGTWFTKGTLERFVRFVTTPEVLELVNTFDAELSQLEAAQRIYLQGVGDQISSSSGGVETGAVATAEMAKKELLKAIDVRLLAVRQDLASACDRALAAGFTPNTVSELQIFADQFGANRLNEACRKFTSFSQRRPNLIINPWNAGSKIRSSTGSSDMSIDDHYHFPNPNIRSKGSHHNQQQQASQQQDETGHLEHHQSKCSTCQEPKPSNSNSNSLPIPSSVRKSNPERNECDESVENENEKEKETVTESPWTSQSSRRLSVQDRINLFENKQKEQSGSGEKKIVVRKSVELRRLSSDVGSSAQAAEKPIFRRWSGTSSDMIVHSSNQTEAATSSSSSQTQSVTDLLGRVEDSGLTQTQIGEEVVVLASKEDRTESDNHSIAIFGRSSEVIGSKDQLVFSKSQLKNLSREAENIGLKDKVSSEIQSRYSAAARAEDLNPKDQSASRSQFTSFTDGAKQRVELKDQSASSQILFRDSRVGEDRTGVNYQVASLTQFRAGSSQDRDAFKTQFGAPPSRVQNVGMREQPLSNNTTLEIGFSSKDQLGSHIHHSKASTGTKDSATSQSHKRAFEGDLSAPRSHGKSFPGELKESAKKDSDFSSKVEESSLEGMKSQRQSSATIEQVQKLRQSKGNQELNDELQLKANELEKLFAEHKLRVPGDQSASSQRSKLVDVHVDQIASSVHRKPTQVAPVQFPEKNSVGEPFGSYSNVAEFDFNSPMKIVDNRDYGNTPKNIMELDFFESSRGKLYDRYMQKRDAKMREEWGSKRAQNEAKMKAMHEILERSRAEMKVKFAVSTGRRNLILQARERTEKFRSFHIRSATKNREQKPIEFQGGDDEDVSEFQEHSQYGQDRSFSETFLGDGSSRISQSNKLTPIRSFTASSLPRISAAPIPRSSIKASISGSGRRRTQPENPLGQSIPSFSEFRKENAKPSGSNKTIRLQSRNYTRNNSKSTNDEIPFVNEENQRPSPSMRKSSASPAELRDSSPLNSDGVMLTPLRFSRDQTEKSPYRKIPKINESKPFLRKGNGIGPGVGVGVGIAKLKASVASENLKTEESNDLANQPVDSGDIINEEEMGEIETVMDEEVFKAVNFPAQSDNEKSRLSQESEKSGNPGSENSEILISHSQEDSDLVAEASTVPSIFHSVEGHVQDSPCESPASWNLRMQNTFSYIRETSDVDASVYSPMGSPASWNVHSLSKMDADTARMRKKWGSAQKPFLVSNTSQQQSLKDVTKGFKRLLKFGRKSRGTEGLVDWISATTSEGDDDMEDGRDLANRSSEDLRKSRMGFSQGHSSYDVFNNGELFNEQVQALRSSIPAAPENFKLREDHLSGTGSSLKAPRSFFSLSSFRSKGREMYRSSDR